MSGSAEECVGPPARTAKHARDYPLALRELPADGGLINDRGYLFHHDRGYYPIPEWLERLEKHGIRLRSGKFDESERKIIEENGKKFAADHHLSLADILGLVLAPKGLTREENSRRRDFVSSSAFWPRMCRGLETRSALAVRHAIPALFGPKTMKNFHADHYLTDPKKRSAFLTARQKFEDDRMAIAIHLQMSFSQVSDIYSCILWMERDIDGHQLMRMWRFIPFCMRQPSAKVAFQKGLVFPEVYIEWNKLSFLTKRILHTCKVCALMKQGLSADDAIAKVSGCSQPRLQPHDLCSFVRIVAEQLDVTDAASLLQATFGRMRQQVESEMNHLGVYGFITSARAPTPFAYCRMRLTRLICNIRRHILPRLTVVYTLRDLLTVVIRTLEDYYMSGEAENEMEEEEQGGANEAASGAVKRLNGIRVATGDLVAHLFLYTREEICKDFVPPWKFKQIVPARFSSVIAMFDETRKTDFYISSTDVNKKKTLIRESTALQKEREGEVEDLLKEEEDGESTDEEELVRVCSGKKKEKGGAKEKTFMQEKTLTGDETDVLIAFVKSKKRREEKEQMEQEKEDVSVEERKKKKKEKKEKRRLEEQREQEETEMEQ